MRPKLTEERDFVGCELAGSGLSCLGLGGGGR